MSEPEYFYDASAQSIIVGDDPRKCSRCGRGPEPTAVIDNSRKQFRTLMKEVAEAGAEEGGDGVVVEGRGGFVFAVRLHGVPL